MTNEFEQGIDIIDFLQWNDNVNLTTRAYNALKNDGINTVPQLEAKTICELRDYRSVGRQTVQNIIDALKDFNDSELTCEHDDQRCLTWLSGETQKWKH